MVVTKPFNPLFEGDVKNEFWQLSCGISISLIINQENYQMTA